MKSRKVVYLGHSRKLEILDSRTSLKKVIIFRNSQSVYFVFGKFRNHSRVSKQKSLLLAGSAHQQTPRYAQRRRATAGSSGKNVIIRR